MDNTPPSAPYHSGSAADDSTAGSAPVGGTPVGSAPVAGGGSPAAAGGQPFVPAQRPGDPQWTAPLGGGYAPGFQAEETAVEGEVVDGELAPASGSGDVIRAEVLSTGLDGPTEVVPPASQAPYAGGGYPYAPTFQAPTSAAGAVQPTAPFPSPQYPPAQYPSAPYPPAQHPSAQYAQAQYPSAQYQAAPVTAPPWAPPGQPGAAPVWAPPGQPGGVGAPGSPTVPYPGFPPPYYQPEPPRKSRRGLIATLVIAGFVVLALCAGFLGYGLPSILSNDSTQSKASPKPSASVAALPADATDDQIVQATLDTQSAALLRGDQNGFLAPVDPNAADAVSAYKRLFHNMTQMHVKEWKTASGSLVDLSSGPQTFTMDITYCLNSDACGDDVRTTMKVTAEKLGKKVMFSALAAPKANSATNAPLPWQVSTLTAVAGSRVVVAASAAWASRLPKVLPIAEQAAEAADSYTKWGKPPSYVVYLASSSEGRTWFHGGLKNADGVSYTLGPKDIQIMIMMPYATENAYAGPGGINAVIQHEMGHVVTLWDMRDRSIDHDDFIEGIAEYISYTGHTSWAKYRIYDTRAYIRGHKWNGKCYLTDQIVSSNVLTSSAAYGIGYLTMRYLATKYGQDKMLSFWGAYERDGITLDAAARQTFGTSWTSVNSACGSYVRDAVGA